MSHNGSGADLTHRVRIAARDPWTALLAVLGGGLCWAVGNSIVAALAATGLMYATGAVVAALIDSDRDRSQRTRQEDLVGLFERNTSALRNVRTDGLPDIVRTKAEDAITAADTARASVIQTAANVDAIDSALAAARTVSGQSTDAVDSITRSIVRMEARRAQVLARLEAAVDEIATVYTGLLELGATARTMAVPFDHSDVAAVADAVAVLHATFAELETEVARLHVDPMSGPP